MRDPQLVVDKGPSMSHIDIDTMTGAQLKALRLANNLTQAQLAEEIGVSRIAVTMWENSPNPLSIRNFKAVRTALESLKQARKTA